MEIDLNPKYDQNGLVAAIIQDANTNQVLMLGWMNEDALTLTRNRGEVHFWSRSRKELWRKGATSGNTFRVVEIWIDCDEDALLLRVEPAGPACHSGQISCFYRRIAHLESGEH